MAKIFHRSIFGLLLFLSGMLSVNAAVYKCKDASGNITYSQTACPHDENVDKIMNIATGSREHDVQCGMVKNFAAEVGLAVEKGMNINELAEAFGGEDQLSAKAVKIMRSVYDYQGQAFKTTEDSIAREAEICKSEQYGVPSCSDFPVSFIKQYGGCDAAGKSMTHLQRLSQQRSHKKVSDDKKLIQERVAQANRDAYARQLARQEEEQCLKAIDTKLRQNTQKARQRSQSAEQQDALRRERRELMAARGDC